MTAPAVPVPVEAWEWFGIPAHFVCGHLCVFHLATRVGRWLVSTVGDYRLHPGDLVPTSLGPDADSLYETMVFRAGKPCSVPDCACGVPDSDGRNVETVRCSTRGEAQRNHMDACRRYAAKQED